MYTFKENIEKKEYDKFIENYYMASFMQDYNWSNIKNNWGNFHCGLYKDEKLIAVCLILVKNIKGIKLFYIPRGYLIDFENYEDLKELTENIKKLAKKNKAYVVKLDPNFCINETSPKGEEFIHNYDKNNEIKHNNLKKLGYKYHGIVKDMHTNFQPQFNMFAPICDKDNNILNTEDILKTYKSKFKYYLGDFHTKRGITFEITDNLECIDKFVELLKETETKQNINLRNKEYFIRIMENFKNRAYFVFGNIDLNKYLEFLNDNNGKEEEINEVNDLINKYGNTLTLSTGLLLLPLNKKGIRTSEYLYAGNSSLLTKLNVSAGLVFEMIKFSMENNCHYCNLGGIDGNLNDRLTTFKQKFNGHIMTFIGEYDLATSILYYPITYLYPVLKKTYKLIRK